MQAVINAKKQLDKLCAKRYAQRYNEAEKRQKQMLAKIKKHKAQFEKSGANNWGYVGDMGYISDNLKELNGGE